MSAIKSDLSGGASFTFDLSLFRASNINHYKSLCCLIKAHNKVVQFGPGLRKACSLECIREAPLAQEHVNPKLVIIRAVSVVEMLRNGIRELLGGDMATILPLGNEVRVKAGAISVDERNDAVALVFSQYKEELRP